VTDLDCGLTAGPQAGREHLLVYFRSGDVVRSRSVSELVLAARLAISSPPARLLADWQRESAGQLEPGDVEALSLIRSRARWPDYRHCVAQMSGWMDTLGLSGLLDSSEVALMACRGARYHHDAAQYGGSAFCNLFLSEDRGLDLHFPVTGQRIPLNRGTALIFDTGQPHAVIPRGGNGFDAADFAPEIDSLQVFLSWELPIENPGLAGALGISFDSATAPPGAGEQLLLNGAPVHLCPASGRVSVAEASSG
jgi:hypothetical protein